MLLATILIALIVAAAYEMYVGSLRSARQGRLAMAEYQAARAVLQTIADDVRSALLTRGLFGFGLRGTNGEDDLASDELRLSCASLVRWRAEPEGLDAEPLPPRADFRQITYRVVSAAEAAEEDTEAGVRPTVGLVREVRTNLTSRDADERAVQVLSRQVVWLNVQYHDGTDWVDDWDAGAADEMPLAVRITLVVVRREEDLLEEEAEPPVSGLLGDEIAQIYPGARTFTTVVSVPTAGGSSELRIIRSVGGFSP